MNQLPIVVGLTCAKCANI